MWRKRDAAQEEDPFVELLLEQLLECTWRPPSRLFWNNIVPSSLRWGYINHRTTTAWEVQSIKWQRPRLRNSNGPIAFVQTFKGHGLVGSEMSVMTTYTWWVLNKCGLRNEYTLFTYSSFCLCRSYIMTHSREACLKEEVTSACHWILNDIISADVLNLAVPERFSVNVM